MDNYEILKILQLGITLMELHGEDSHKIRTFNNAFFNLERHEQTLDNKSEAELKEIAGVGASIAKVILEIVNTGTWNYVEDALKETPVGIQELLAMRGVGTAKIRTVWKEKGVESPLAFLELAKSGELEKLKGFGKKTVENIIDSLEFYFENKSKFLIYDGQNYALELLEKFKMKNPDIEMFISGDLYRKSEIIEKISFVTSVKADEIRELCNDTDIVLDEKISGPQILRGKISELYSVEFLLSEKDYVVFDRMVNSISGYHFMQLKDAGLKCREEYKSSSEENIYHSLGIQLIPEETREFPDLNFWKMKESTKELIKVSDMKGMLHCHSTYSDGRHSLKEMAQACIDRGYEYLGICDHSKSAFFYANGLFEHRVLQQQEEIDLLNKELAPFKIFKGIESDILADGNLDYENEFLNNFDFVVASIHSGLTMDIEKAMSRLLTAIMNPHTTILGHLTGRILLARKGYPIDHKAIIDACAEHKVGIEINAHQSRLDIDWRWVAYAVEKGVVISINPDAHSIDGLDMTEFGVIMARKAGLTSDKVLNTKSTNDIEKYFKNLKKDRGI